MEGNEENSGPLVLGEGFEGKLGTIVVEIICKSLVTADMPAPAPDSARDTGLAGPQHHTPQTQPIVGGVNSLVRNTNQGNGRDIAI